MPLIHTLKPVRRPCTTRAGEATSGVACIVPGLSLRDKKQNALHQSIYYCPATFTDAESGFQIRYRSISQDRALPLQGDSGKRWRRGLHVVAGRGLAALTNALS